MYSYYLNLGFVILCYRYGVLTLKRGLILAADIFNGKQLCATGYKSLKKLISETYGSYYVFKSVFLITITELSMANFRYTKNIDVMNFGKYQNHRITYKNHFFGRTVILSKKMGF